MPKSKPEDHQGYPSTSDLLLQPAENLDHHHRDVAFADEAFRTSTEESTDELDDVLSKLWVFGESDPVDRSSSRQEQGENHRCKRSFNRPVKQIVEKLRGATHPSVQLYIAEFDRKTERRELHRLAVKNDERKAERAAKRGAPRRAIEQEAKRRLRTLKLAIKYSRGDKLLEQLGGRADELVQFWVACQITTLARRPQRPSDQDFAVAFADLSRLSCSRHQARSRRKLLEQLEVHPAVWLRL